MPLLARGSQNWRLASLRGVGREPEGDDKMQGWLRGLAASAADETAVIIANAVDGLPTVLQDKTSLLMACQMIIWQKETKGEEVREDLAQLRKLRNLLLE